MPSFGQDQTVRKRQFDDAVNVEREARYAAGTDIKIIGYGWVALQGRPEDQDSLAGLAQAADLAARSGDSDTSYRFVDRNNLMHVLTGAQMIELFLKGAQFISNVHFSSTVIKAGKTYDIDPKVDDLWYAKTVMPT